jgi:hypothetical protein
MSTKRLIATVRALSQHKELPRNGYSARVNAAAGM